MLRRAPRAFAFFFVIAHDFERLHGADSTILTSCFQAILLMLCDIVWIWEITFIVFASSLPYLAFVWTRLIFLIGSRKLQTLDREGSPRMLQSGNLGTRCQTATRDPRNRTWTRSKALCQNIGHKRKYVLYTPYNHYKYAEAFVYNTNEGPFERVARPKSQLAATSAN